MKKKHRSPKKAVHEQKYRKGVLALRALQTKLGKPPKRGKVEKLVKQLVEEVGLRGHKLEYYFKLYATCALLNKEALCRYWKG